MAASSTTYGEQIADGEGAATLQVPSGHRFVPTDNELVEHYLLNRILQLPQPCHIIKYIASLYSYDSEKLPIAQFIHGRENEAYFFTHVDSNHWQGTEQIENTNGGYWKSCGDDHHIYSRQQIIGFKKTYALYRKDEQEGDSKARWMLFEYRVNPDIILPQQFNDNVKAEISRVICKLQYQKQNAVEDSECIGEEESLR